MSVSTPTREDITEVLKKLNMKVSSKPAIPQLGVDPVQFSSVAQSCPTLCNLMNCSTPGLLVLHHLPEFAETHSLSQWCHPTISSSVAPFSSCLQSSPASGSFPVSRLFASGGQSTGSSASASVLPVNIQDWFLLGLIDWFDLLAVQRTLKNFLQHHTSKSSILQSSAFFMVQLSHPYMTTGITIALTRPLPTK